MNFNLSYNEAKKLKKKGDIIYALNLLGISHNDIRRSDNSNKSARVPELKNALLRAITIRENDRLRAYFQSMISEDDSFLSFEDMTEFPEFSNDQGVLPVEQSLKLDDSLILEPKANNTSVITIDLTNDTDNNANSTTTDEPKKYFNEDCPICLCDDVEGMKIFECKHRMHSDCCKGLSSSNCPICSKPLTFTKTELATIKRNKIKYGKADIITESQEIRDQLRRENGALVGVMYINGDGQRLINNIRQRDVGTFAFGQPYPSHPSHFLEGFGYF